MNSRTRIASIRAHILYIFKFDHLRLILASDNLVGGSLKILITMVLSNVGFYIHALVKVELVKVEYSDNIYFC
jgi:hypothetical protein